MRVSKLLATTNTSVNIYKGTYEKGYFLYYNTHPAIPSPMREEDVKDLVIDKVNVEFLKVNGEEETFLRVLAREETPTERLERRYAEKISLIKATELATELLCGEFEAEPYEAAEFCRNLDLSETEIDFLVPEEYKKYFEEEDDDNYEEEWNDDSDRSCKDCPPDECTGHCMSCYYRSV